MSMKNNKSNNETEAVMATHFFRITYRTVIFAAVLWYYITARSKGLELKLDNIDKAPLVVLISAVVYVIEMIARMIPSRFECIGNQKVFKQNYIPTGNTEIKIQDSNITVLVGVVWLAANSVFGLLHANGIWDDTFLFVICCFYSICDYICIFVYCPFQRWFFKNRCCTTCRIYNWDYPLMFTPLLFVRSNYLFVLPLLATIVLIVWEYNFAMHTERFSDNTNASLKCENCTERMCRYRKSMNRENKSY